MPVFGSRIYVWWRCCWWCRCVVPLWYVWIEQTGVPSAWKNRGVPTVKVIFPREAIFFCDIAWTFYEFLWYIKKIRSKYICVFPVCVRVLLFFYITHEPVSMYPKRSRLFPSLPKSKKIGLGMLKTKQNRTKLQVTRLGLIQNHLVRVDWTGTRHSFQTSFEQQLICPCGFASCVWLVDQWLSVGCICIVNLGDLKKRVPFMLFLKNPVYT